MKPLKSDSFGSSPLTRGKPVLTAGLARCIGLIPAHAGKTLLFDNTGKDLPGSSPLTRGKRDDHGDQGGEGGLIPAHAGKTSSSAEAAQA